LVDEDGNELEMPSEFDDFTDRAHRSNLAHSEQAQKNMLILEQAMHAEGFEGWPFEWWHYDLQGWNNDARYPSLDIPLQELVQQIKLAMLQG
jgi:D-alanyl-D-alanine dipeptidase